MDQIKSLLDNKWIHPCGGTWGSQIVLATRPHQEYIDNMKNSYGGCVSHNEDSTKPQNSMNI